MGNKAANVASLPVTKPSTPGEWQKQGTTGHCDITGQLAEQYIFQRDMRLNLVEDCQRYEFRRQQKSNLVEVYQVERDNSLYMCQGDETIRVKTERIVSRLSEKTFVSQQ
jgi:hypothetical protein